MNISKYKKIPSVVGFDAETGVYSINIDDNEFIVFNEQTYKEEYASYKISKKGNRIYTLSGDGIVNIWQNEKLSLKIQNAKILENTELLCIYKFDNSWNSYYSIVNPYTNELILKDYIPYNLYVNEEIIVAYNNFKGEIKRIKTDTTNIWQFPLSSLGADPYEPNKNDEISKILGVVYGNLWLTTKAERIVALDVNTGEKKYQNEGFGVYLDEKSQNIFSIASNIIEIINTRTLSIEERFNFLEADPKGIGKYEYVYSPLLQGDYFTFLGRMPNDSDVFRAGIFDYKARKLVWEHQFISEEEYEQTRNHLLLPQPLYMSGNKLYIKDFKNNLHIYEKEEPNCKTNL